jgi:DNA-directed RNA polymerase specialized sigma24 family protein
MRAWLFTIMHNQNVNSVRSAMREGMTVDIEEQSSNLVATTDPTVARQLHELDRALAQVPEEQRQATRTPQRSSTSQSARSARACHAGAMRSAC